MPLRNDHFPFFGDPLEIWGGLDGSARLFSGGRHRIVFPFPLPLPPTEPEGEGDDELPETLLRTTHATVIHGDDPGDFYCEHLFFVSQREAAADGSQVQTNSRGERLVGFLHVPWDRFTEEAGPVADQAGRHRGTREVVGAALYGFVETLANRVEGPMRVLLGGYDKFGSVVNNPTGDFVSHQVNIDGAVQSGFGSELLAPRAREADGGAWDYRIRRDGGERILRIKTAHFTVDDTTLDAASAASVQQAMRSFRPHVMVGMGVHSGDEFLAEHRADSGGLDLSGDQPVHLDGASDSERLPDNFSLARAIYRGGQRAEFF